MSIVLDLDLPIGERRVRVRLSSGVSSVAIVGPSGIGKSTLLRAIAGLLPGAQGRVEIDDRRLEALPPQERGIGWVPQDALLFPHLTVSQNVSFAGPADAALVRDLGVEPLLHRTPGTLSGGERQRVALARALSCRPRVLLLDEPLAALDRDARAAVVEVLRRSVAAHAMTSILVAHDESDVAALAEERFALDRDGLVPV